jgi:hypothetical protein
MIVRINQIDPAQADATSGWPVSDESGFAWPSGMRAMDLFILSEDENRQPLSDAFRRQQFRQMLPQIAIALRDVGESPVLRLHGPLGESDLLAGWQHLTDADGRGRYAFSAAARTSVSDLPPVATLTLAPSWKGLSVACADGRLGIDRAVQSLLLLCPDEQVPTCLTGVIEAKPDWQALLGQCSVAVRPTRSLRSIQLFARHMDMPQVKQRIMQRLMAVARGEPSIPA